MNKITPHVFFFLLLSFLYGLPILLTLFFDLNDDMPYVSDEILSEFKETRWIVLWIYIISFISFITGSYITRKWISNKMIIKNILTNNTHFIKSNNSLKLGERLFIYFLIFSGFILFIIMYKSGALSVSYMESFEHGVVSQNMFTVFCDIYIYIYIYLWHNYDKKYKNIKILLFMFIAITVFKGSRMFTIPIVFFILYRNIYVEKISRKKIIHLSFFLSITLIGLFSMFFIRHNSSIDEKELTPLLLLLIQYESCGVHIPLMKEILLGFHTSFAPIFTIITDTILFLVPRFIFPSKNNYLYFDTLMDKYNLSPFGGTNGEASIILYFGILFPLAFIIIGSFFSYIYTLSKTIKYKYIEPLYIYLCCSLLFTFLRNGILIVLKNIILIIIIIYILNIVKRITFKIKK